MVRRGKRSPSYWRGRLARGLIGPDDPRLLYAAERRRQRVDVDEDLDVKLSATSRPVAPRRQR